MFEFAWPMAFIGLALPFLVHILVPRARHQGGVALRVPFYGQWLGLAGATRGVGLRSRLWLPAMAFALLCSAAARPQWLGDPQVPPRDGRDLMLAVDTSGSMAAEDMSVGGRRMDRLQAIKLVVGDFLKRRVGDRVGLILFGQNAYLVTPLTFDLNSVRHQLDTSVVGLAGRETAIGDAVGLAVKRLRDRPQDQRVLILLTDGANNAGALQPMQAAELAAANHVRVHTIAFGSDTQRGPFGLMMPSAEMDEPTLEHIAERTGGRFFRARNTAELAGIYAELDRLEPVEQEGEAIRPRRELFMYPATAAMLLALLALALQSGLGRVVRTS
ncbi:MAG TPA: VWA domain-containing protein [Chiayiivirga sp.]|nr:VWA domain-containing protein [Chiayiivirga sp.]